VVERHELRNVVFAVYRHDVESLMLTASLRLRLQLCRRMHLNSRLRLRLCFCRRRVLFCPRCTSQACLRLNLRKMLTRDASDQQVECHPQAASVNEHDLLETRLLGHALDGRRAAQGAAILASQPGGRQARQNACLQRSSVTSVPMS
jgi:hypothetical protein